MALSVERTRGALGLLAASLLTGLVFACVTGIACASGTGHGGQGRKAPTVTEYLQPEPGPYTPVYIAGNYSRYHDQMFDDQAGARSVQMVVISDKTPAEAVFIASKSPGPCTGREVVHITMTFSESDQERDAPAPLRRIVKRGTLDCATAAALEELWQQMLCEVRYDEREKVIASAKIHANVYHFSSGSKSGVTEEGDPNTLVGQLEQLGLQLAEFADASNSMQKQMAARLSTNAARLLTFVRARNVRPGAPPFCAE
jgi:hypothetical protein